MGNATRHGRPPLNLNLLKGHPVNAQPIRVRFAPAPTGTMHIGNIRTALLNYLYAKQHNGTFVLRIEDTDPDRNFDPGAQRIMGDLRWLSLTFDEGPGREGNCGPYLQSERTLLYQEKLDELKAKKLIYPCFCSEEELEKKRDRQRALKLPPRYDRTCLGIPADQIAARIERGDLYIWRMKVDHTMTVTITDLAHGNVTFDLKNFSDFALSRTDGTFTFLFANFVDDLMMRMTHVFRGEDHLSNTANQAALYRAFNAPLPIFWHMPILCSVDGKKLSKRDFGFSLNDLKKEGFLPEAINNYLAIIGVSFEHEIMSLEELTKAMKFDSIHASGSVKYDVEKLRWINHQWINRLSLEELSRRCMPFILAAYPAAHIDEAHLTRLLTIVRTDLYTLADVVPALSFYFVKPELTDAALKECVTPEFVSILRDIIAKNIATAPSMTAFVDAVKADAQQAKVPVKQLFWTLRLGLMNAINGPSIHDLVAMLGQEESKNRIKALSQALARLS